LSLVPTPTTRKLSLNDISQSLRIGWDEFRSMPGVSLAFGAVFAVLGLVVLMFVFQIGISAMALPFAAGFMLLAPIFLVGFFRLSELRASGARPGFNDALAGFKRAPAGLWVVALLCTFLFLVWITDAGVLYSFMIGEIDPRDQPFWLNQFQTHVVAFTLWSTLMGSVLAFIAFAISAFSVPLLFQRRATTVQAVFASVHAVVRHFIISLAWGLLLTGSIVGAILLLPLLAIVLPIMSYASFAFYLRVFPPVERNDKDG
jgi:uncharacterized membrane protein